MGETTDIGIYILKILNGNISTHHSSFCFRTVLATNPYVYLYKRLYFNLNDSSDVI